MIFVVYKENKFNIMKKSKIIVPALAVIAFSTVASITGTVAWFTANSSVTVNAGSYTVATATSGLTYSLSGGVGTQVTGSGQSAAIAVKENCKLTDASFDHSAKKIFEPNSDGSALKNTAGTALDDATEANMKRAEDGSTNIYSVFTWNITFKVAFKSTGNNMALYLDTTADHSAFSTTGTTTALGFRMAFVGQTSGYTSTKVFADLQDDDLCTYVTSSSNFQNGIPYDSSSHVLIDKDYAEALPNNDVNVTTGSSLPVNLAGAQARNDYLGYFAFAADTEVSLSYKVVCWFEGTDPNIVTSSTVSTIFDTVTATLTFAAVNLKA